MPTFSQRKGLKPLKTIIQTDSMDESLRNGLWNALSGFYFEPLREARTPIRSGQIYLLLTAIWASHFKKPIDTLDDYGPKIYETIRGYFFNFKWNEVYDFVEFVAESYSDAGRNEGFMSVCNDVLKRELSAYRFVGGKITQITSESEMTEIEEALKASEPLKPVNEHLKSALGHLSNRKSPDYRNSIKESISAVEAISRLITNENNATLGTALDLIDKQGKVKLHPALKAAFDKLYGYTSASDGIRHAMLEESSLDFEDAKFMLVGCSAFINYLIVKSSKAGIKLG